MDRFFRNEKLGREAYELEKLRVAGRLKRVLFDSDEE